MSVSRIQIGQEAPLFTLPGSEGQTVELAQYRGRKNVVLLFYPLAWTPV
ncbi:MAG: hypothetical protein C7B45_02170 [Sulfobacillus acidophilus]|uniref:Alkyl hydroperoxide reductase subunit C/ Thiol specific antioxidant domain-containing protein n=1 Tax=Sulfobacillus acidophilus TaxID=53633 RepID=A0A2T2WMX9_9FIRM|nr:MAG: hypothetical protein C7B45_02170 [Sulfobacillus acidophilus]